MSFQKSDLCTRDLMTPAVCQNESNVREEDI